MILVPETAIGFSRAIGETHRRYSGYINARLRVTGHLFQGPFGSVAMDEDHLMAAFRYLAQNPVKARLVERAQDWRWSSTPAHIKSQDDELVTVAPLLERVNDAATFLENAPSDKVERALAGGQSIGRPLVNDEALTALEH